MFAVGDGQSVSSGSVSEAALEVGLSDRFLKAGDLISLESNTKVAGFLRAEGYVV